jgi:hypothetical protein
MGSLFGGNDMGTRYTEGKTYKSLGPGYVGEAKTAKGNKGFARGATRDDAGRKAQQDAKKKDRKYRF